MLVRSIYTAWEGGDFTSAEWAHPQIDFVIADGPVAGHWTGLSGMAAGMRELLGVARGFRTEADELRELDDTRVLVLVHRVGRGRSSGLDVANLHSEGANLFHLRDGAVTRLVVYFDRERALGDLGLSST